MAIFYLFHHLAHYVWTDSTKSDGQKNSMIFLLGVIGYVLLWVGLFSLRNNFFYTALKTGYFIILCSDIAVMAYTYKAYYGRFIFNELRDDHDDNRDWRYNDKDHKFSRKNKFDRKIDNIKADKQF